MGVLSRFMAPAGMATMVSADFFNQTLHSSFFFCTLHVSRIRRLIIFHYPEYHTQQLQTQVDRLTASHDELSSHIRSLERNIGNLERNLGGLERNYHEVRFFTEASLYPP